MLSSPVEVDERVPEVLNPFEPPSADADETHELRRPRRRRATSAGLVDADRRLRLTNRAVDTALHVMVVGMLAIESDFVTSLLVQFFYFVVFESVTGKTPAKWLTHTRVITTGGSRPTVGHVIKRTLVRFIPFEPLSFLGRGRGWHDHWSGTRVVYERGSDAHRRRR